MIGLDPMRCLEEIHRLASERRQGEHVLRSFVRSTRATIGAMYGDENA